MVAEFNPDVCGLLGAGPRRLLQQPEYRDAVLGPHEHLAIGNGRRDELVAGAKLVAVVGGLGTVIELVREIGGVVGVQHRLEPEFSWAQTIPFDVHWRTPPARYPG